MQNDQFIEYTKEGYDKLYAYIDFLPDEQKKFLLPVIISSFVTF